MACRFESGHRHQRDAGPDSFWVQRYFFALLPDCKRNLFPPPDSVTLDPIRFGFSVIFCPFARLKATSFSTS